MYPEYRQNALGAVLGGKNKVSWQILAAPASTSGAYFHPWAAKALLVDPGGGPCAGEPWLWTLMVPWGGLDAGQK